MDAWIFEIWVHDDPQAYKFTCTYLDLDVLPYDSYALTEVYMLALNIVPSVLLGL